MHPLQDGHWNVQSDKISSFCNSEHTPPYFIDKNTFIVLYDSYISAVVRKYSRSEFFDISESSYNSGFTFQTGQDDIFFRSQGSWSSDIAVEKIKDRKMYGVRKDDKSFSVWKENNIRTDYNIHGIRHVHSYSDGQAIAYWMNSHRTEGIFLQYKDGLWYQHYETQTQEKNNVSSIWAIDEKNFIAVGLNNIVRFCDGVESHPIVSVSGWSFNTNWQRIWGINLDKYWVMDVKGNVAQFEHEQFRGVIRGPKLPENTTFQDAWVSPEGVVYAITKKEVYRLD